jgi:hypothetical protein
MMIYLHSDAAEQAARYVVTVAPGGDTIFVKSEDMPQDAVCLSPSAGGSTASALVER